MPITLAQDPRLNAVDLPPAVLVEHERIASAIDAYSAAKVNAEGARRDRIALEQERPRAVEADAQLLASALESEKPDPGQPATLKRDGEIADAKRREEASEIVVQRRLHDLRVALDESGDEWTTALNHKLAEAVTTWQATIDQLIGVYVEITRIQALLSFTTTGRFFSPGALTLPAEGTTDVSLAEALQALRQFGLPSRQLSSVA